MAQRTELRGRSGHSEDRQCLVLPCLVALLLRVMYLEMMLTGKAVVAGLQQSAVNESPDGCGQSADWSWGCTADVRSWPRLSHAICAKHFTVSGTGMWN